MFTKRGKALITGPGFESPRFKQYFARVKLIRNRNSVLCFETRFETVKVLKVLNPDNIDKLGYLLI